MNKAKKGKSRTNIKINWNNSQLNAFIKANEEYQKLINEGLATKRGFNIMTTEEIYNPTSHFTYTQSIREEWQWLSRKWGNT